MCPSAVLKCLQAALDHERLCTTRSEHADWTNRNGITFLHSLFDAASTPYHQTTRWWWGTCRYEYSCVNRTFSHQVVKKGHLGSAIACGQQNWASDSIKKFAEFNSAFVYRFAWIHTRLLMHRIYIFPLLLYTNNWFYQNFMHFSGENQCRSLPL